MTLSRHDSPGEHRDPPPLRLAVPPATVEAGHRAIIFNRISGIQEGVVAEGTHIMIPFIEWPIIYDVRTRPRNIMSLTGSKGT
jgi:hypothetical protein